MTVWVLASLGYVTVLVFAGLGCGESRLCYSLDYGESWLVTVWVMVSLGYVTVWVVASLGYPVIFQSGICHSPGYVTV